MSSFPNSTDGPDSRKGGCRKCKPMHEEGLRSGFNDYCCCCDPCRYFTTTLGGQIPALAQQKIKNPHCCKCVPQMLCMVFTPDAGESECCRSIIVPMIGDVVGTPTDKTIYTGSIGLVSFEVSTYYDSYQELCLWKVFSEELPLDEEFTIDHFTTTCLEFPGITIDGFSIGGCTGQLSISTYDAGKVEFVNRQIETVDDVDIPSSPCDCIAATKYLCVSGVRHVGGDFEVVEFVWNEDIGDRWEYLPLCGSPTTDREIIYLRGDSYGNCYLELDFEQLGPWTNDWADPPNTLGVDPQEVRDGMILIDRCGCGLMAYSETTGDRYVRIHAGHCSRWKYICGTCRCVPQSLCVIGEIEGEFIETILTWDGTGWAGVYGTYDTPIRLYLTTGTCLGDPPGRLSDDCVIVIEGYFNPEFEETLPIECSKYLAFEMRSKYDAITTTFNWLWASASFCGCEVTSCGICATERCGGPPKTIYADLQAIGVPNMDNPLIYPTVCDLTVTLHYYQRWNTSFSPPVLFCGYIGYAFVDCPTGNFILQVEYIPQEGGFTLTRIYVPSGIAESWIDNGLPLAQDSCDPFAMSSGTRSAAPFQDCFWGCVIITEHSVTLVE